jgi:hypothetical protein
LLADSKTEERNWNPAIVEEGLWRQRSEDWGLPYHSLIVGVVEVVWLFVVMWWGDLHGENDALISVVQRKFASAIGIQQFG